MKPYNTKAEYENEIRRQVELKHAQRQQDQLLEKQDIINHYKNYQLGQGGVDTSDMERRLHAQMQQLGMQPQSAVQNGANFQNDGNRMANVFESKPINLFDDQFLRQEKPVQREKDPAKMNERDRRIYLRDLERERRNQPQSAGIGAQPIDHNVPFGGVNMPPPQKAQQNFQVFPGENVASVQNKRDMIWAQKQLQRQAPDTSYMQPINQPLSQRPQDMSYARADSPLRTSLTALKLQQAKDLDIHLQRPPIPSPKPPLNSKTVNSQPASNQDVTRLQQNALRKVEYNEFLAQQNQKLRGTSVGAPITDVLQNAGMLQIGDHQHKLKEDKFQRQQDYKKMLEQQQIEKANTNPDQRRKQIIADQVFNEVLDSQRYQQQPYQEPLPKLTRVSSAVGSDRQAEFAKLQMQQTDDPFFKAHEMDQEVKKRNDLQKKREYGAMLQEQMSAKRIEQDKSAQLRQQVQQQPQYRQPFQVPPQQLQAPQQYQATLQYQVPPQYHSQAQVQEPYYQQDYSQPTANYYEQQPQISKQEEYRRLLEDQIRIAAEQKQRAKQDQMLYEQKHDLDTAQMIEKGAPTNNQGRRGPSDITKPQTQIDERQAQAKLKYQEELKQQMQEQKQRKEQQERQRKIEDQKEEQKMIQEREKLAGKEIKEIKAEGRRDVEEAKPARKVRRDQFEPSSENITIPKSSQQARQAQENQRQKSANVSDLFIHPPPSQLMPSELFTGQYSNGISLLDQRPSPLGQPSYKAGLFDPTPQNENVGFPEPAQPQYSHKPFNQFMVQPHPQINQQLHNQQQPLTPVSAQPSHTQVDWQQQQASKMFEDQQKMIQLYQQALEQILKYRNQYFEQAMEMRENILKEREQLFEYEKMKAQQQVEISQLKAVQNQLSGVQQQHQILPPQVQSNLTSYITQQKDQILKMSQSQAGMHQLMQQSSMSQAPKQTFKVETSRVQLPQATQHQTAQQQYSKYQNNYTPSKDIEDIHMKIDELAEQIAKDAGTNYQNTSKISENLPNSVVDFEESLSSKTKLVRVPENNLAQKVKQIQALQTSPRQESGVDLLATWNENSLEGIQISARGVPDKSNKKSPFKVATTYKIPELIPEEDAPINVFSPAIKRNSALESLNARDSSDERNLPKHHRTIDTGARRNNTSIIDRKTGSSFYDQTLKNKQMQEITQQEEMQKQLARIFGNTQTSAVIVRDDDYEDESQNSKAEGITPSLHQISEAQSDINIAMTQRDEQPNEENVHTSRFHQKSSSEIRKYQSREESVWDDPDVVPVEIMGTMMSDFQVRNAHSNDDYGEEDAEEGTIKGLKMFCPTIISTQEMKEMEHQQQIYYQQMDQQQQDDYEEGEIGEESQQKPVSSRKSDVSKKEFEMMEIAALIRKATSTTNSAIELAEQRKREQQSKGTPQQKLSNKIYTAEKPLTAKPNLGPIFEVEGEQTDSKILADLDRIINNLELQQKNMATFGMPDGSAEDQSKKPNRKEWKTLKEAREERPTSAVSNVSQKAPLPPRKENLDKSHRSKSRHSGRNGSVVDGSPQTVGKFAQMALYKQNSEDSRDHSQDRSQTSKSPHRIGKFAQMALKSQKQESENVGFDQRSVTGKSPQRVGKYAQMALASQTSEIDIADHRSQTNKSPQRVGKYSQMALQKDSNNGSVSPKLGKYAQMAIQSNHDISQDDIENYSQKFANRQQSKERERWQQEISQSQASVKQQILRPVSSGTAYSGRYEGGRKTGARPVSGNINIALQVRREQLPNINDTPGMTVATHPQKAGVYFSDEEDDNLPQFSQKAPTDDAHPYTSDFKIVDHYE